MIILLNGKTFENVNNEEAVKILKDNLVIGKSYKYDIDNRFHGDFNDFKDVKLHHLVYNTETFEPIIQIIILHGEKEQTLYYKIDTLTINEK